jgi:hypothetical protein
MVAVLWRGQQALESQMGLLTAAETTDSLPWESTAVTV